jgi:hypothetical protein
MRQMTTHADLGHSSCRPEHDRELTEATAQAGVQNSNQKIIDNTGLERRRVIEGPEPLWRSYSKSLSVSASISVCRILSCTRRPWRLCRIRLSASSYLYKATTRSRWLQAWRRCSEDLVHPHESSTDLLTVMAAQS